MSDRVRIPAVLLLVLAALPAAGCGRPASSGPKSDSPRTGPPSAIPDRTVVLTFDDGARSHLAYVAPRLAELGFRATFMVTNGYFAQDTEHYLTWAEVAKLAEMGFEVGNHTWSHQTLNTPESAATVAEEVRRIDEQLERHGVPRTVSFAWPIGCFGPESLVALQATGMRFARRGMAPECPYDADRPGAYYDPRKHHPLLIPTTANAHPGWTIEYFRRVVDGAREGRAAVLQFHGVPDLAAPKWSISPELFEQCLAVLGEMECNVIGLGDLARYADPTRPPADPMTLVRCPLD